MSRLASKRSMTATELIQALQSIPGDTVVTWTRWDSEYDIITYYSVGGVSSDGVLERGEIVRSFTGEEQEIAWLHSNTPRQAVMAIRQGEVVLEQHETVSEAVVRTLAGYAFLEDYDMTPQTPEDMEISRGVVEVLRDEGVLSVREYESLLMARQMLGYDD